jgi:hypothetical protein
MTFDIYPGSGDSRYKRCPADEPFRFMRVPAIDPPIVGQTHARHCKVAKPPRPTLPMKNTANCRSAAAGPEAKGVGLLCGLMQNLGEFCHDRTEKIKADRESQPEQIDGRLTAKCDVQNTWTTIDPCVAFYQHLCVCASLRHQFRTCLLDVSSTSHHLLVAHTHSLGDKG